jgi:predicted nucleic acid-binding protein
VVAALFDTNILIDNLNGSTKAHAELARYEARFISIVTWIEVMAGADTAVAQATEAFLAGFRLVPIDDAIARRAVTLRRQYRIKVPDAIIWASAQAGGRLLVTRNVKDFPPGDPGVRVPYKSQP